MQQQSVFAKVAPRGHFAQSGPNCRLIAVMECMVPKLSKLIFRHVKIVQVVHFVKEKVHSSHPHVLLDLTQVKLHPQSAHFALLGRTPQLTETKMHLIAKNAQRALIVQ